MKKNSKKGFTLVELVIVIAVIAILAAVMIPTFSGVIASANKSSDFQEVKAAIDGAYQDYIVANANGEVLPYGVGFIDGATDNTSSQFTFTEKSHDMYTIVKTSNVTSLVVSESKPLSANITYTFKVNSTFYSFKPTAAYEAETVILFTVDNPTTVNVGGVTYAVTSSTTGTPNIEINTETDATTLYYAAASNDYAYVTGRKGYVFKVSITVDDKGNPTYTVEDMDMKETELDKQMGLSSTYNGFYNLTDATNATWSTTDASELLNRTLGQLPANVTVKKGTTDVDDGKILLGDVLTVTNGATAQTITIVNGSETTTVALAASATTTITVQGNVNITPVT